jgi:hypothetical protein
MWQRQFFQPLKLAISVISYHLASEPPGFFPTQNQLADAMASSALTRYLKLQILINSKLSNKADSSADVIYLVFDTKGLSDMNYLWTKPFFLNTEYTREIRK